MKFRFVDFVASYSYAFFLVSLLGLVLLNISHHVIAVNRSNASSVLTEPDLVDVPSAAQYTQGISGSVPDAPTTLKEEHDAVIRTSAIESSSAATSGISGGSSGGSSSQENPLPAAVLNQGTLSDQLVEPAAAVVTLAEEATSTLQQRASQSLDVAAPAPIPATGSNTTTADNVLPSVIHLPGLSEPPPVVRALPKVVPPEPTPQPTPEHTPEPPKEPPRESQLAPTSTAQPDDAEGAGAPPSPPPPPDVPQEDIPSFSEWTQKQLEEAEKKKSENRTAPGGAGAGAAAAAKVRSKNYASPDCGAKVVATNPEAENPSGVLSSSRDDYLINTCTTTRQYIVIELCEAIQAKKLELANLELFSSSPKEFSVSLSRTFPTRDWSSLGHFAAKDERTIQSFALQPLLFGKFVRVDFHTHHGHEHFCCTTLIRVYGTSEFEVLETEEAEEEGGGHGHGPPSLSEGMDEDGDDDDDEGEGEGRAPKGGRPRKNLFGHATEAVFSIVKKAAAALVKTSGAGSPAPEASPPKGAAKQSALCCTSPRHIVVCNNCSDEMYHRVYRRLSCQRDALTVLAAVPWVRTTLGYSRVCSALGLDVLSGVVARNASKNMKERWEFLKAFFSDEYIAAICNVLAVEEQKVAVNMSHDKESALLEPVAPAPPSPPPLLDDLMAQTCSAESTSAVPTAEPSPPRPDIRPTRTIKKEQSAVGVALDMPESSFDEAVLPPPSTATSASTATVVATAAIPTEPTPPQASASFQPSATNTAEPVELPEPPAAPSPAEPEPMEAAPGSPPPPAVPTLEPVAAVPAIDSEETPSEEDQSNSDLDAILTEMKTLEQEEQSAASASAASAPPTPRAAAQVQKESVFLRLSNKIKALDRNMSLSGQYLEELSRRYKKQEELGRALNKSLAVLWEEARRARSREQQAGSDLGALRDQVHALAAAVDVLLAERSSWKPRIEHLLIIVVEMGILGLIVWTWRRLPSGGAPGAAGARKWSAPAASGWKKVNGQSGRAQNASRASSKRRNSLDGRNPTPPPRKRRPSEEAVDASGSYKELVRPNDRVAERAVDRGGDDEGWLVVGRGAESRRQQKKRRKAGLPKSSSTQNLVTVDDSGAFYTPNALTPTDDPDPRRRISVPAKVALNARAESHSGPPWRGGPPESPEGPLNVCAPSFMQTAASVRSRRSVSSLASACGSGGDAATVRQPPPPPPQTADEAPPQADALPPLAVGYLPSQSDLSDTNNRTAGGNGSGNGSGSPRGSICSRVTTFGNGESSKKTKKRGLKSMVKKLF